MDIVIDTCVLVTAVRSRRGASFRLLSRLGTTDSLRVHLSTPLVLEYEEVLKRQAPSTGLSDSDVEDLVDYLCSVSDHHEVFFLWRPFLRDPDDEMVLEVAVEANCEAIVTFNTADFRGAERFGLRVLTPGELLSEIGEVE